MRTLALRALREFWEGGHADAEHPLREWFRFAERADWSSFADLRRDYPSADQVGDKVIFNIKGNRYRLIVQVNYAYRIVLVKWVGTHAEYDRLTAQEIKNL